MAQSNIHQYLHIFFKIPNVIKYNRLILFANIIKINVKTDQIKI